MTSKEVTVAEGKNPAMPENFVSLTKNMEQELEQRRSDWEHEVSKMQQDFFKLKGPSQKKQDPREGITKEVTIKSDSKQPKRTGAEIFDISHAKTLYCDQPDGSKLFKLRFDVKGYQPEDIHIKAEGSKLRVTAKSVSEIQTGNTAIKEFNRQVDIPKNVDPDKLVSFLSTDGILSVEAPVEDIEDDEEEEEVVHETHELGYDPSLMIEAGMQPPGYHSVSGPGYSYTSERSVPGHSYTSERTGPAGYSYSSTGPAGYSYTSSSRTPAHVPSMSYSVEHVHHGPHHKCHSGRDPMKTHPHLKTGRHSSHTTHSSPASYLHSTVSAPTSYMHHSVGSPSRVEYHHSVSPSFSSSTSSSSVIRSGDPQVLAEGGGRRLRMVVDVGKDYTAEDVHVTISGRKIAVQASKQAISATGRTSKRQFSREFHSPEDLETSTAMACLGTDGRLAIGAAVKGTNNEDEVVSMVRADMPDDGKSCNLYLD